jgi:hypothetical protein
VGKTALGLRFANELSDRYPDGQLHVNLAGFADDERPVEPVDALGHLLAGMGIPLSDPVSCERLCGLYRSLIAGQRMLILLDNARTAEQVRPLLPGSRSCLVLVTSRNALAGLTARDGARRLTLNVMPDGDLLTLMHRAIGRPLSADEDAALGRVVAACGGLPLAVRIAAERIASDPSPEAAIEELLTAPTVLDHLHIHGDPHSSMRAVFAWSFRTLAADAAALFRALGKHSGPAFSLSVAAALGDLDIHETRRSLNSLIAANLVREVTRNCFRLNRLLYDYAVELATAPDARGSTPYRAARVENV